MKTYSFETADFIESTSWVLQNSNISNQDILISYKKSISKVRMSYRDRTVFFESIANNVIIEDSEDNDDDTGVIAINSLMLSRFVKVVPKKAPTVVLEEHYNTNGQLAYLIARAGNLKANIPCYTAKRYAKPQVTAVAQLPPNDFFPSLSLAGSATNNAVKEEQSIFTTVDLSLKNDKIVIFGTDSFVMNLSKAPIKIINEEFYDKKAKNDHFLIASHFSNLKTLTSVSKNDESIEIIVGNSSQKTIGFKFENNYSCLFTCVNIDPLTMAEKVFDNSEKSITHVFPIEIKKFKDGVKNIISLSPETESINVSIRPDHLVISDKDSQNSLTIPIENIKKVNGDNDDDFSVQNISFSHLVINKMFNTIGNNDCLIHFANSNNGKTVFITYGDDINKSKIVTALYTK